MTNTEIKLILLDYKEFDYVPELGGYWIYPNVILPSREQLFIFFAKYKIFTIIKDVDYLNFKFYMNLLNFNNYSDWIMSNWPDEKSNILSYNSIFNFDSYDRLLDICRVFNNVYK